uniref:Uncharacterized protein n=1 Tax=Pseudictyota dubia TaxID=2749911 RepID=A0A7R9Z5V8_9STRA
MPRARKKGQTDKKIKDAEGVSLHQRKNQLCRRLRDRRMEDPRMSRAVAAKLDNLELPLEDALAKGGFVFPIVGRELGDACDRKIRDQDNVTLFSRKKELMKKMAVLDSTVIAHISNIATIRDGHIVDLSPVDKAGQLPVRSQPQSSSHEMAVLQKKKMEGDRNCLGTAHHCTIEARFGGVEQIFDKEDGTQVITRRSSFDEKVGQLSSLDDLEENLGLCNFNAEHSEVSQDEWSKGGALLFTL